jgi:hypothetical protein
MTAAEQRVDDALDAVKSKSGASRETAGKFARIAVA